MADVVHPLSTPIVNDNSSVGNIFHGGVIVCNSFTVIFEHIIILIINQALLIKMSESSDVF